MSMTDVWNPWHGCIKYSEGCENCYVYRRDTSVGRDASEVYRTSSFDMPVKKNRSGEYKVTPGSHLFACMTSDFFLDLADQWRDEAWDIIRRRPDVSFTVITKRIDRAKGCLPSDWGDGWDNVRILVTMENQRRADERLPILISFPAKHKGIICEPLLSPIDFRARLTSTLGGVTVASLTAGGESGPNARICDYSWILSLRDQCEEGKMSFGFKQTGARFVRDGRLYKIPRRLQHSQARSAGINIEKTVKDLFEK